MLRWDEAVLADIDGMLTRARGGQPGVLVIEGEPGMGKSSLLDEIAVRAHDFRDLFAEGFEGAAARSYGVLAQLGLSGAGLGATAAMSSTSAAQELRALLDAEDDSTAVCIRVDDLQWADEESVDALIDVLSRAAGDRLLLTLGTRPLDAQLPRWRRWAARPGRVRTIGLVGLTRADAIEVVRDMRPEVAPELAQALWHHTGGSPLYLRTLVSEYDAAELAGMSVLPAPAEFAHTVTARLDRVSPDACILARALSVLGPGWGTVRDAGLVAEVELPAKAAQELVESGLVELRAAAAGDQVRPAHALVRSAIYQTIPLIARRELHARAATAATVPSAVLEHRLAGTDQYDDALARDLETHALALHDQRAYRQAAHYLTAASAVTADLQRRQQRWLDSLFETLLTGDTATVRAAVADIEQADDRMRRDLVLGALAQWERRPFEALAVLRPWAGAAASEDGLESQPQALTRYRIEVLLAWAGLYAGAQEGDMAQALQRAGAVGAEDPALRRLARMVAGQLAARHVARIDMLPGLADVPEHASAVPVEKTELLAWRGIVRAGAGLFVQAVPDLEEIAERIQRGQHETGGGVFHALLACAQWFVGDWAMARLNLRIATDLGGAYPQPVVQSITPLLPAGEGRDDEAMRAVETARRTVLQTPWLEAVNLLTVSEVVRLHAGGQGTPRVDYAPLRTAVAAVQDGTTRRPAPWLLHAGLAALWSGARDDARFCAHSVAATPVGWAAGAAEWLYGLVAESVSDGRRALQHLRAAVAADLSEVPLYRAHIHFDHARAERLTGAVTASARSLDIAADIYRQLGAVGYLNRVDAVRDAAPDSRPALDFGLSGRERDVVTLLTTGMSYVQIARALFVTRSTVSFHLVNIYAKANVGSRHELTELAHQHPDSFGLPVRA